MQRIRLAAQVGSGLCGVLYVLDEPTIGLHPRDNARLLVALKKLRDLGNTLLLVEHDREVIANADKLLDFGPGAGRHGGQIVAEGSPQQVGKRRGSVTGPYLTGKKAIAIPTNRRIGRKGEGEKGRKGEKQRGRLAQKQPSPLLPFSLSPCFLLAGNPRGTSQQPEGHRRQDPAGHVHRGYGAQRQRQELAGRRRALCLIGPHVAPRQYHRRRPRLHPRHRAHQQGDPRRPAALGSDSQFQPGHVHGVLRPDPRALRPTARGKTSRLSAAAVQLQRGRRPLREVRGQRPASHRDALPARRLGGVRHVPRPALQRGDACRALPRQVDRRGAGHALRRGRAALPEHTQDPPHPANAVRRGPRLSDPRPTGPDALRRRGPARETGRRTLPPRHRKHALPARRADHRPALRRPGQALGRAQSPRRVGQHRGGHRAQSRRDQDGRLGHRHGAGSR